MVSWVLSSLASEADFWQIPGPLANHGATSGSLIAILGQTPDNIRQVVQISRLVFKTTAA